MQKFQQTSFNLAALFGAFLIAGAATPVSALGSLPEAGQVIDQTTGMAPGQSAVREPQKLGPTPEMAAIARRHNAMLAAQQHQFQLGNTGINFKPDRPFADFEEVGYLIISVEGRFDSLQDKIDLVKNLPAGVTAIILVDQGGTAEAQQIFSQTLPSSRLKFVEVGDYSSAFWARDSIPIPVWMGGATHMALTGARYYHGGDSNNQQVADMFAAKMNNIDYYNEGGNFEADAQGNCLLVHNERSDLVPDSVYTQAYGCHRVTRLPHLTGIGHVDEVVRLLPKMVALTDQPDYKSTLEGLGYHVELLPQSDVDYGTYANALLINGTVFMPSYGNQAKNNLAISVYQKHGLRVVPLGSEELSSDGEGSIHCITMTFPKAPLARVTEYLHSLFN